MANTTILSTHRDQLTVEDVAHYLRVDAPTVTSWLENADLPGYRLPTRWLIMSDDLDAWLQTTRNAHSERRSTSD